MFTNVTTNVPQLASGGSLFKKRTGLESGAPGRPSQCCPDHKTLPWLQTLIGKIGYPEFIFHWYFPIVFADLNSPKIQYQPLRFYNLYANENFNIPVYHIYLNFYLGAIWRGICTFIVPVLRHFPSHLKLLRYLFGLYVPSSFFRVGVSFILSDQLFHSV